MPGSRASGAGPTPLPESSDGLLVPVLAISVGWNWMTDTRWRGALWQPIDAMDRRTVRPCFLTQARAFQPRHELDDWLVVNGRY